MIKINAQNVGSLFKSPKSQLITKETKEQLEAYLKCSQENLDHSHIDDITAT